MDAAAASRRSIELSAAGRGRSKGLTSDHRGMRRAVMVEFYTTVRATGRRPRVGPTPKLGLEDSRSTDESRTATGKHHLLAGGQQGRPTAH